MRVSKNKNIIALIPARAGSRSIPKKNIVDLGGYPLIAFSIAAAKMSKLISRVIVSTDSEEIAGIARNYGAEVPFIRPTEFATDKAGDLGVVRHAFEWLKSDEKFEPEYLVYLRPTTPLRDPDLIDKAVQNLIARQEATCLRSAHELSEPLYKFFGKQGDFFVGLFPEDSRPEYYNLPRQSFPPIYHPDGYVDIWKRKTIIETEKLHGPKILSFISSDAGEVDSFKDLEFVRFNLEKNNYRIYEYLKNNFKAVS